MSWIGYPFQSFGQWLCAIRLATVLIKNVEPLLWLAYADDTNGSSMPGSLIYFGYISSLFAAIKLARFENMAFALKNRQVFFEDPRTCLDSLSEFSGQIVLSVGGKRLQPISSTFSLLFV